MKSAIPRVLHAKETSEPFSFGVSPHRLAWPSPDGRWRIEFHTPREWHMGAEGWQIKLFHGRRNVTAYHREIVQIAGNKGFRCAHHFQPWSHDSNLLALVTWDETPLQVYEIATSKVSTLKYSPEFVYSAQWAPDVERLLITSATAGVLVNRTGEQRGVVRWEFGDYEVPNTFWMKSGSCFFLLGRKASDHKTMLTFYRGEDGAFAGACVLDPSDIVPYDWENYVELPRDKFCLVCAPGVGSVGALLDIWGDVSFDQASNTLLLSVLRPVSAINREGGQVLCQAERRWIAVTLEEVAGCPPQL